MNQRFSRRDFVAAGAAAGLFAAVGPSTPRGARVGDIFMSLIHTSRLCGANPFDYLTALECHADQAGLNPANWMPWNYRQTLANAVMPPTAS